jgi:hypothetical protein
MYLDMELEATTPIDASLCCKQVLEFHIHHL